MISCFGQLFPIVYFECYYPIKDTATSNLNQVWFLQNVYINLVTKKYTILSALLQATQFSIIIETNNIFYVCPVIAHTFQV